MTSMESSASEIGEQDVAEASPYDEDTSQEPEPEPEIEVIGGVDITIKDVEGFTVKDDAVTVQVAGGLVVPMIIFSEMMNMNARKHGAPGFQQAAVVGTHVIDGVRWGLNWTERQGNFRVDITRGYVEEQYLRSNVRQQASRKIVLAQNHVKNMEAQVASAKQARIFEKSRGGTAEDQDIELQAREKRLAEAKAAVREAEKEYEMVKDSRETRESWIVDPDFLTDMIQQGVSVKATRIDLDAQLKERGQ